MLLSGAVLITAGLLFAFSIVSTIVFAPLAAGSLLIALVAATILCPYRRESIHEPAFFKPQPAPIKEDPVLYPDRPGDNIDYSNFHQLTY